MLCADLEAVPAWSWYWCQDTGQLAEMWGSFMGWAIQVLSNRGSTTYCQKVKWDQQPRGKQEWLMTAAWGCGSADQRTKYHANAGDVRLHPRERTNSWGSQQIQQTLELLHDWSSRGCAYAGDGSMQSCISILRNGPPPGATEPTVVRSPAWGGMIGIPPYPAKDGNCGSKVRIFVFTEAEAQSSASLTLLTLLTRKLVELY